jgi:hypothetical protein
MSKFFVLVAQCVESIGKSLSSGVQVLLQWCRHVEEDSHIGVDDLESRKWLIIFLVGRGCESWHTAEPTCR